MSGFMVEVTQLLLVALHASMQQHLARQLRPAVCGCPCAHAMAELAQTLRDLVGSAWAVEPAAAVNMQRHVLDGGEGLLTAAFLACTLPCDGMLLADLGVRMPG